MMLANVASGHLLSSDKVHFHLLGFVNKQNFRYWAEANPRQHHEKPLHSQRVTVLCAVADFGIIGPYFFEGGHTVTVNSDCYVMMLLNFLQPRINDDGNGPSWFQQHGATVHSARISQRVLGQLFPGHLISLHGDIPWPARSPDLSPCNFVLWEHLKSIEGSHGQSRQWRMPFTMRLLQYHRKWLAEQCGASRYDYSSASLGKITFGRYLQNPLKMC